MEAEECISRARMTGEWKTGALNKVAELISERGRGGDWFHTVRRRGGSGARCHWVTMGERGSNVENGGRGMVWEEFGIWKYWDCWGDHISSARPRFAGRWEWSIALNGYRRAKGMVTAGGRSIAKGSWPSLIRRGLDQIKVSLGRRRPK